MKIPLIRPSVGEQEFARVKEVLESGYLTEGPVTREFEQKVADFVGVKHAIAFTSNSTGMETALRALGLGPGDEVIVPAYTHPITAGVVAIVGATPVFVDVDPATANIDYNAIKNAITEKTKAILPVSQFGNPLDYDRLDALKKEHNLLIIEDAACSIGASFNGKPVGSLADVSIFSFHPRKFITTGEGGMATTDDGALAEKMRAYKNFGMSSHMARVDSTFTTVGTNFKLSNILAALGTVQMDRIDALLTTRREQAKRYDVLLDNIEGVGKLTTTPGGIHSYQSYCVLVKDRDRIMQTLREQGIEVQIGTFALHQQGAFKECKRVGALEHAEHLFKECLTLPLYDGMTVKEQELVVSELQKLIQEH